MRVIIADDSKIQRDALRQTVRALGHDVVGIAKNGDECVKECAIHKPDLVIIDVLMAPGGGQNASLAIKAAGTAKYIVMATSQGQDVARNFAAEHGFGFSVKPYAIEKIRQSIAEVSGADSPRTGL